MARLYHKTAGTGGTRAVDPGYGFAQHKGYPTPAHLEALKRLGPCPEHRRSFGPVSQMTLF